MSAKRKAKAKKLQMENPSSSIVESPNSPNGQERNFRRWLVWFIVLVFLIGGGLSTYFLVDYVLWPRIPIALVGQWRGQGGSQNGVTLEFSSNGAFQARAMVEGKEGVVYARAQMDEADTKKLNIISMNPDTGKEEKKTHIIHSLTKTELVMEDPTGEVSKFVRLD